MKTVTANITDMRSKLIVEDFILNSWIPDAIGAIGSSKQRHYSMQLYLSMRCCVEFYTIYAA